MKEEGNRFYGGALIFPRNGIRSSFLPGLIEEHLVGGYPVRRASVMERTGMRKGCWMGCLLCLCVTIKINVENTFVTLSVCGQK